MSGLSIVVEMAVSATVFHAVFAVLQAIPGLMCLKLGYASLPARLS
jgi:hypothetical protein